MFVFLILPHIFYTEQNWWIIGTAVGSFIGFIMMSIFICVVYHCSKRNQVSDRPSTTSPHAITDLNRHTDSWHNGSVHYHSSNNSVQIDYQTNSVDINHQPNSVAIDYQRSPDDEDALADGVSDESSDEFAGSDAELLVKHSDLFPVSEHDRSVNPLFQQPINWMHV